MRLSLRLQYRVHLDAGLYQKEMCCGINAFTGRASIEFGGVEPDILTDEWFDLSGGGRKQWPASPCFTSLKSFCGGSAVVNLYRTIHITGNYPTWLLTRQSYAAIVKEFS